MIACLDVHYRDDGSGTACAAAVLLDDWTSPMPALEQVIEIPSVAAYEPGSFYKRELPCLLAVLAAAPSTVEVDVVVIDGYVWLGPDRPGLGAHLHEALGRKAPVVGVAKTFFQGTGSLACEVFRGASQRPLYVTAVGMPVEEAAEFVRTMHGEFRLPGMLKRVDGLCRGRVTE